MALDSPSLIIGQIVFGSLLAVFFFFLHTVYPDLKGAGMLGVAFVTAALCRCAFLIQSPLWFHLAESLSFVATLLIYFSVKQYLSLKPLVDSRDFCLVIGCLCTLLYLVPALSARFPSLPVIAITVIRLDSAYLLIKLASKKRSAITALGFFMLVYGLYAVLVIGGTQTALATVFPLISLHFLSQTIIVGNVILSAMLGLLFLIVFGQDIILQLERQSMLDSLTNTLNRRGIECQISQEISRYKRNREAFSIALLDIDRFKTINDTFGHAAGDRAICDLASLLTSECRAHDLVGRLGGDEIVMILPSVSGPSGLIMAQRLCATVQSSLSIESTFLSVSIGVAECSEVDSLETLLKRADIALYDAKRSGKACARLALPDVLTSR
ncbi:GGDEF domain-containing protein [Granulicella cerasi]|uniref:diguanylate cyclase n=1 Tax=Granulicella cerasi TaxID=741063 RepID=A0ABW1Z827_9BACT|nr:GGDEF domain-containing protein [Granulicella cerasi]